MRCSFISFLCFVAHPPLNVTPTVLCSGQPQRFAADERDRFGFDLSQVPGCRLRVAHRVLRRVPVEHVGLCGVQHKRTYVGLKVMWGYWANRCKTELRLTLYTT